MYRTLLGMQECRGRCPAGEPWGGLPFRKTSLSCIIIKTLIRRWPAQFYWSLCFSKPQMQKTVWVNTVSEEQNRCATCGLPAVCSPGWLGMQPSTKSYIYLKHYEIFFFVITCYNVFNVWPNATLLPVWPRDVKMLDIHMRNTENLSSGSDTQELKDVGKIPTLSPTSLLWGPGGQVCDGRVHSATGTSVPPGCR